MDCVSRRRYIKSDVGGTYDALAVAGNTLVPFTLALLLLLDLLVLDLLGLFSATLLVWCYVSLMLLESSRHRELRQCSCSKGRHWAGPTRIERLTESALLADS